jgi:hypothetical protein
VRGYRVELGEIEAALARHPDVHDAVVVARDLRLVAYVATGPASAPAADELRAFLSRTLPEYMVPSSFVALTKLPLTPNGKVDRQALPSHEVATSTNYVAPATDLERTLAHVWEQVLHVERVGAEDNFFEVGGNSILLIEVNTRLREELERDISSIDLFTYPSVRLFAQHLEAQLASADGPSDAQLRGQGRAERLARRALVGRS